jgi:serine/threonine protein phosphatase PrpC
MTKKIFIFLSLIFFITIIPSQNIIEFGIQQGNRPYQEDRASLIYLPKSKILNLNIFDGHGGDQTSTLANTAITSLIKTHFENQKNPVTKEVFENEMKEIFSYLAKEILSTKTCNNQGTTAMVVCIGLDDNMQPLWIGCANTGDTETRIFEPTKPLYIQSPVHNISVYTTKTMHSKEEEERITNLINQKKAVISGVYWRLPGMPGAIQITKSLEGKHSLNALISAIPSIIFFNQFTDISSDKLPDILIFSDGFTENVNISLLSSLYTGNIHFTKIISDQKNNHDNTTIIKVNLRQLAKLTEKEVIQNVDKIDRAMKAKFKSNETWFSNTLHYILKLLRITN